ncbi:hypothetical protein RGV33_12090 [Pseudomonas sp. Bout1]|uniref:hypothetical protein n=1 Tax=Pseudomonas sp. Bout1 TaxID=3048600 RepID=UPI002AB353C0|nr:hypothetical protein [Pseudomonas sp. Bout1]MDY7532407.1 hypothetical protein [Pseudomonas sp. Bout1]MEB0184091.1 hypothetical protein [Pseudomonas sp. Bout1]
MEFKTAQMSFRLEDRPAQEAKASFTFSQHRGALDKSTYTYQKSNKGFSWLAVKTEPFEGWLDTSSIEFSFPDEAYGDYTVQPGESITQDGEWLWFPVRPLVVTAYSDHD